MKTDHVASAVRWAHRRLAKRGLPTAPGDVAHAWNAAAPESADWYALGLVRCAAVVNDPVGNTAGVIDHFRRELVRLATMSRRWRRVYPLAARGRKDLRQRRAQARKATASREGLRRPGWRTRAREINVNLLREHPDLSIASRAHVIAHRLDVVRPRTVLDYLYSLSKTSRS